MMISRSSRSSVPGTPGDYVPLLWVLGAPALTKSLCQPLARKLRHAAAKFAVGVDKVVDKVLVVFSMVSIRWFKRSVERLMLASASSTLAIPWPSPRGAFSAHWWMAWIYPVTYRSSGPLLSICFSNSRAPSTMLSMDRGGSARAVLLIGGQTSCIRTHRNHRCHLSPGMDIRR